MEAQQWAADVLDHPKGFTPWELKFAARVLFSTNSSLAESDAMAVLHTRGETLKWKKPAKPLERDFRTYATAALGLESYNT